jgi:hypothetical protein
VKIMGRFLFTISILVSSLVFSEEQYPDSVIWGKYCGECVGECSKFYKLTEGELLIDLSGNIFNIQPYEPINYIFSGVKASEAEYKKYSWLLNSKIPSAIPQGKTIIGEPDSHDQCGYFLSYNLEGTTFKALIDPEKVPDEMQNLIRKMMD